jgi:hypothetical protein
MDEFLKSLEEEDSTIAQKPPSKSKHCNELPDDLDAILNDPDFETEIRAPTKPSKLKRCIPKKCTVVHIGKNELSIGQTTCPNIRCMKCDCGVICFDDYEWIGDIEYLFLRNNYPDFDRLQSKLKPTKNSTAYACQCNSVSTRGQAPVNMAKSSLKWFCGSH